jgi:SsrA-binding protein
MAKAADRSDRKPPEERVICRNRRASFDYELLERFEAGLVLTGTEVKSLRGGKASIEDAFASVEKGEAWLHKADIPEYAMGNRMNHEPRRKRKLLLHRSEILKLGKSGTESGCTLIPIRLYFKGDHAKVEIAVAKGKREHDKRQSIKTRDSDREMKRTMHARNERTRR